MLKDFVKSFRFSLLASILVAAAVAYALGIDAFLAVVILSVIEITFSFDNAIINAKVLAKLSPRWQRLFLTLGIAIAIVGMRVLFPVLLIVVTAHTSFGDTIDLALYNPHLYAEKIALAHPAISAFGGMFLITLALNFFMLDKTRPIWIKHIERPLKLIDKQWAVVSVAILVLLAAAFAPGNHHALTTLEAGAAALVVFFIIHILTSLIPRFFSQIEQSPVAHVTGMAAFFTFVYLEVLDASFSLDGVLGAFAVTNNIVLIAAGLGIGALWVRSLTIYMVRKKVLRDYAYMEHGAHYAILFLAVSLLLSLFVHIPSFVVGILGLAVILASILSSVKSHRR